MNIIFTNTKNVPEEFFPKPASKYIPDWYKNLDSYTKKKKVPNGEGMTTGTIKRCMPVFDSLNAGYIISTPCDIWVSQKPKDEKNIEELYPFYEWANYGMIEFHPIEQAPNYPHNTDYKNPYPKWMNPWSIKTPSGYSTIFVQPWHRESIFTIFPAIVDTDTYSAPVNFPFILNNPKFTGLIEAGTPIAQVIPFKRDSWNMHIGNDKDLIEQGNVTNLLRTKIFDSYKEYFRKPKEYK